MICAQVTCNHFRHHQRLLNCSLKRVGVIDYGISLGLLNSSVANLVVTSEPVFTAILAYFVLSERLLMNEILGGAIILAGVLLLRLWKGRSFKKRFLAPSHLAG